MKKLAVAFVISLFASSSAHALTLEAGCEKTDTEGRIGIRVNTSGDIVKVHPGSPADRAGLRPHDMVVAVDGRHRAVRQIAGEPGTMVNLDVRRGMRRFTVAVQREDVRTLVYE
jgi:C-terminal processing protease CtpA/Prc